MSNLIFDFDRFALGNIVLGELLSDDAQQDLGSENMGYQVYTEENFVTGIFICFRDGYRGYKKFQGSFLKNHNNLESLYTFMPVEIERLFGKPYRQWDDGSEVSIEYEEENYHLEFVWRIKGDQVQLNYFMIDLLENGVGKQGQSH